jgi:hypothetical protein
VREIIALGGNTQCSNAQQDILAPQLQWFLLRFAQMAIIKTLSGKVLANYARKATTALPHSH